MAAPLSKELNYASLHEETGPSSIDHGPVATSSLSTVESVTKVPLLKHLLMNFKQARSKQQIDLQYPMIGDGYIESHKLNLRNIFTH